jgi:hypothetical protein
LDLIKDILIKEISPENGISSKALLQDKARVSDLEKIVLSKDWFFGNKNWDEMEKPGWLLVDVER